MSVPFQEALERQPRPIASEQANAHADPRATAVDFSGVRKRYGETVALDGINLSLRLAETVALLGPNGAGKSTAIGLMLGLVHPSDGQVRTLGLTPGAAMASGRVGAMLQSSGLPAGALVGEVVDFARGLYANALRREEIVGRAGIDRLLGRRVEALSGGESTRVRFALAIAGDPDLVFLDEPTVGLDVEARRAFWEQMHGFADEGRTVLFATHYLEEADEAADRIVVLGHGRILADGTARSIKAATFGRSIRFSMPQPDRDLLARLPGVSSVDVRGDAVSLVSSDADAAVYALVGTGIRVRDLEVTGAGLDDAFLALTSDAA